MPNVCVNICIFSRESLHRSLTFLEGRIYSPKWMRTTTYYSHSEPSKEYAPDRPLHTPSLARSPEFTATYDWAC